MSRAEVPTKIDSKLYAICFLFKAFKCRHNVGFGMSYFLHVSLKLRCFNKASKVHSLRQIVHLAKKVKNSNPCVSRTGTIKEFSTDTTQQDLQSFKPKPLT